MRDKAVDSRALEIVRNNRCNKNDCPNKGYACIAYRKHAYIRINSDILKTWDKAIRKGQITIIESPRALIRRLLKGIATRKTAKKVKENEKINVHGLTININNGPTSAAKEAVEVPF
jgi:hypothetical protein